ncbi:histidine kinase [Nonomuraea glycinis]|uniref:sensor histidine kinase n=1 Tax=Nonomuraea glycinis TaxID=2047744 RepID=UPI001CD9FBC1|nr:histidine kinase [Nonomuraea glycinis]MCA2177402.1 histidine kinase [Nonomuraea glycinis]
MRWNRLLTRRWACLILGGALLMPYMMAGVLISGLARGESADLLLPVEIGVFGAVLPVVALTGLFLPVRSLEVNAAQGLLGARVEFAPGPAYGRRSWQERRRTAAWFTLHLGIGGLVSGFTLAVVPFTLFTLALPFVTLSTKVLGFAVETGWPGVGWALLGLGVLALLVLVVAGAGALLARLAPVLLGPTPAERLATAEEHARTLAERNRLARELHDSVGHALSVVTLQAAAASRVLDRDPATARTALAAIEQSARAALEDLDHVLGVLREDEDRDNGVRRGSENHHESGQHEGGGRNGGTSRGGQRSLEPSRTSRAPQATLADLDALVTASGAEVRREVGDLSGVPAVISREAYRIVQEALTNAIKHGQGPVNLAAGVREDVLDLQVTNTTAGAGVGPGGGHVAGDGAGPLGRPGGEISAGDGAGHGGGRGITGMAERVRLLRGELDAGPVEGGWRVSVRLPLRSLS